ncbi:hypothetical protein BC833DRAFT_316135 [Globomyces pollinis-pini]|nr:hypothetical protein BC833DRAFT_316135 [Globomyces pollinis-pini]
MKETQTFLASHLDFGSQTLAPPSLKKIPSKTEIITPTAPAILHRSVSSILRDGVSKHDIEEQDPFYVADLSEVVRQYKKWQQLLPRVQPFYGKIFRDLLFQL